MSVKFRQICSSSCKNVFQNYYCSYHVQLKCLMLNYWFIRVMVAWGMQGMDAWRHGSVGGMGYGDMEVWNMWHRGMGDNGSLGTEHGGMGSLGMGHGKHGGIMAWGMGA